MHATTRYVDAAWNASSGFCGMGWVIQDSSNSTRSRSFSSHRRFVSSEFVAECYFTEALALRSALSLLAANTDD
ncbi:unnamed protein product [Arabidopsis lyrata]|uniref:Predicted protein n=1 Tax=Arabidopsis lyrata subsp. lyrata TaxID=81972 RepID=D7L3R0_ARALL|nr:predicted protein [Arabidopsis lyrata subsp. lyrata]CAH8259399.1 unnamed protein product [Arabidopsis lyrata]